MTDLTGTKVKQILDEAGRSVKGRPTPDQIRSAKQTAAQVLVWDVIAQVSIHGDPVSRRLCNALLEGMK